MTEFGLDRYAATIAGLRNGRFFGKVTRVVGLTIECRGLQVGLGELCEVESSDGGAAILSEVVGFKGGTTILMPIEERAALAPGATVHPLHRKLTVSCGDFMLGRVLDALGRPLDAGPALPRGLDTPVFKPAPNPLLRENIDQSLESGVSVIDGLLTLGLGQRMGIFAGSGVGKSTLLGTIARESSADVNVIALIGERGREVREFIDKVLGPEGLAKSVLVVATSDSSPIMRQRGAFTATAIAEYFRDQGRDVMLMMDSITRLANATREIGLASGEPPTVKGYPPSFFSTMPKLVERMGRLQRGSITGLLTVLVDADDMNEPVADTMRGLLDGHIVLSRKIAARGQFPAVDVLNSTSRIMDAVVPEEQRLAARSVKEKLAVYEDARDLIMVGAYREGSDPRVDEAVGSHDRIMALLKQTSQNSRSMEETRRLLAEAARPTAPKAANARQKA
ncbi:MAG: FliI/YscN family ATPase [Planctomycetes bacterium]|nr:FliI/YscN family ATPase [Planctomycetota bacterium]